MQYLINGFRKKVSPEVAKGWFKFPETLKIHPLINSNDVIIIPGMPTIGQIKTNKPRMLQIKAFKDNIFMPRGELTKKYRPAVAKFSSLGHKDISYNICQLTGKLHSVNTLEFARVYDKILLVNKRYNMLTDFLWLEDRQQFVKKADFNTLGLIVYKGSKKYYATSTDWVRNNYSDVINSTIENCQVLVNEAKRVITNTGGNTTFVSKFEIENQEHNTYRICQNCNLHVLDSQRDGNFCIHCTRDGVAVRHNQRNQPREGNVFNYSHKVENDLGFDDKDCETVYLRKSEPNVPVFLGLELEYNVAEVVLNKSAKFINTTNYAQCKSDSSILQSGLGNGYEIVTQPCSLNKHRDNLKVILDKFKEHYVAGPTCGLHVHVSRQPFTDGDIGKMLSFVHREANRGFIGGLARRESHRYARLTDGYIKSNKADPSSIKRNAKNVLRTSDRERYTALNVKDATLEFRIFACSTDLDTIMASAQFCEALCLYAKAHTISPKYSKLPLTKWIDITNFLAFIKDSQIKTLITEAKDGKPPIYEIKQKYPELEAFIITQKLPTTSKNTEEVLYEKVKKSIMTLVIPVYRHREIPKRVVRAMVKELLDNRPIMLRWLHETSEGRNGIVKFNDENNRWELITSTKEVIWSYIESQQEKVA